jgi:hypothetical protein
MLTGKLRLVLEGQFDQAGIERPRMYVGDRVMVARRALANTGFDLGQDPRLLAERLHIVATIGSARDCGGELVTGGRLLVTGRGTRRERGLLMFHAIAHALLDIERWEHSHGDAWMLTGDLALPSRDCRLFDATDVIRRAHVPAEFSGRWIALSARMGRRSVEDAA